MNAAKRWKLAELLREYLSAILDSDEEAGLSKS